MIFSSKTPLYLDCEHYDCVAREDSCAAPYNEPNPILVDLRSIYEESHQPLGITVAELASDWLDLLEEDPAMIQPRNWGLLAGAVTGDPIDHARRVLTRLAALEES